MDAPEVRSAGAFRGIAVQCDENGPRPNLRRCGPGPAAPLPFWGLPQCTGLSRGVPRADEPPGQTTHQSAYQHPPPPQEFCLRGGWGVWNPKSPRVCVPKIAPINRKFEFFPL